MYLEERAATTGRYQPRRDDLTPQDDKLSKNKCWVRVTTDRLVAVRSATRVRVSGACETGRLTPSQALTRNPSLGNKARKRDTSIRLFGVPAG